MNNIYLAAAIAAILQCIFQLFPSFSFKSNIRTTNEPHLFSLRFLRIAKFDKPRWRFIKILSLSVSSFLLLMLAILVFLFIHYKSKVTWTPELIISLIVFTGIPVLSIYDDIMSDRRFKNHQPSRVFKSAILHISGTYENIFFTSTQALAKMGGTLIEVNQAYGFLSVYLGQSYIHVEIKNIIVGCYEIAINTDSDLPSTKWDFGANQKIIDQFTRRFLGLS
jgi:hypothetical protein